jgi:hypothetical protein
LAMAVYFSKSFNAPNIGKAAPRIKPAAGPGGCPQRLTAGRGAAIKPPQP